MLLWWLLHREMLLLLFLAHEFSCRALLLWFGSIRVGVNDGVLARVVRECSLKDCCMLLQR
jgi:hypothetical protein